MSAITINFGYSSPKRLRCLTEMAQKDALRRDFLEHAHQLIKIEAAAISELSGKIDKNFCDACELALACRGKLVVIGLGKSGHIGSKIAATLASTGTPAFFMHAAEALHGDLGMVSQDDLVLAISNSGETQEVLLLLPALKQKGVQCISITGNPNSRLAHLAAVNLNVQVHKEACPLGLAPTSSTTATLVMGDALAISLLKARGFTKHDFARTHPQGKLGRRLTLKVSDLMTRGANIPKVTINDPLAQVVFEITSKRLGMTTVLDAQGHVCGIITDGDLRRHWTQQHEHSIVSITAQQLMTPQFKTTSNNTLAYDALTTMRQLKITHLVILSNQGDCEGIIHVHHLLQAAIA